MSIRGQHTKRAIVIVAIALGCTALALGLFFVDPRRATDIAGTVLFKDVARGLGIVFAVGVAAALRALMGRGTSTRGRRDDRGGRGSKGGSHRSVPGRDR